jgi:hypothetical protein
MPRFLPRLPHPLYIALRVVFMSRLTPVLLLLIAAAAFLLQAVLPHEPSQADIVQAFSGYKTKSFESGPLPFRNITKKACNQVAEAHGYLCEVQYTMQRLRPGPPDEYTQVFRLFKVEGGGDAWGQQFWNANVQQYAAADAKWREGHALWTLIGYTIASVVGAVLLCTVLPAVPWNGAGMNERATPRLGRSIRSGSSGADNIADFFTTAANNLTPAGAMGLFSLALGIGGFMLGSWMLPQLFIDLRVMGWIERLCLLTAGLSMSAVGFCLPMLLVRLAALSVVVLALYALLVLPAAWIFTGSSPAQTISKNMDSIGGLFTTSKPSVATNASKPRDASTPPRRQGFEGYQQIFAF